MTELTAAEEPSMDEILASIRKIIAEEEISDPAAPQVPRQPEGEVQAARPKRAESPTEAPSSLSARLNGVFGNGVGTEGRSSEAGGPRSAAARSAVDDDLSDLFGDRTERPVSAGLPPMASMSRAAATADQTRRPRPLDLDAVATHAASVPAGVSVLAAMAPAPLATTAPAASRAAVAPGPQLAAAQPDRTAPIMIASAPAPAPASATGVRADVAESPAGARTMLSARATAPLSAMERSLPPVEVADPVGKTQLEPQPKATSPLAAAGPVVLAAMPERQTSRAPANVTIGEPSGREAVDAVGADAATRAKPVAAPVAEVLRFPELAAVPAVTSGQPGQPAAASDVPAQMPAPATASALAIGLDAVAANSPSATTVGDDPAEAAVASALGALAAGLAAAGRPAPAEIVLTPVDVAPGPAPAAATWSAVPGKGPADAAPPAVSRTSISVFTSPDAFVGGVSLEPVPMRTLDDTAAELLRPMLRQWLDANMPRIVEKALRIELAVNPALVAPPKDDA